MIKYSFLLILTAICISACTINPVLNIPNNGMSNFTKKTGTNIYVRVDLPFQTKASANGQSSADLDYLLINLSQNVSDPVSGLVNNEWLKLSKSDLNKTITFTNVRGGDNAPGTFWYAVAKAFDLNGKEIAIVNKALTGASQDLRISISNTPVYVGFGDYQFYTDNSFKYILPSPPVLTISVKIENIGADISSSLNIINGKPLGPIQAVDADL